MRWLGAFLLGLLAVLTGTAAAGAAWTEYRVVSVQGFSTLAAPLGTDPAFQDLVGKAVAEELTASLDLPEAAKPFVAPSLTAAAQKVTGLPGYPEAWTGTVQRSHELTVGAGRSTDEGGKLIRLDLAPIVELAVTDWGTGLGVSLNTPEQVIVEAGPTGQQRMLDRVLTVAGGWGWGAGIAGLLALLSLIVAKRSSSALAWLGAGVLVSAGTLWLGAAALLPGGVGGVDLSPVLLGSETAASLGGVFLSGLLPQAVHSFQAWCIIGAAGGVALLVIGLTARIISGQRPSR